MVEVEAVERLSHAVEYVVGDIHNVVDRAYADGLQAAAQPFRALGHLHAADGDAAVARSAFGVEHLHSGGAVEAVGSKALYRRAVELRVGQVAVEVCREVAGHAVVAGGIDAVGGEVHLHHPVALELEILGRGGAGRGSLSLGDDDDAVVGGAGADLVLGADHAERLHAAYLRFFDLKRLVAAVEGGAHGGHYHSLAGGHICGAAHYLGGLAVAEVHGGDVQVVAVGVIDAGEHLADHDAFEATLYRLHLLEAVGLEANRGQRLAHLSRSKVEIKVIL